jgi:hypothetical protein
VAGVEEFTALPPVSEEYPDGADEASFGLSPNQPMKSATLTTTSYGEDGMDNVVLSKNSDSADIGF